LLHLKKGLPRRGYTLIELCCVLSLIGLIIGLSFGLSRVYTSYTVRSELNRLHTVITYLRRKAVVEQQPQSIRFTSLGYSADREWQLPANVIFGIHKAVKGPPSDPKKPLNSAITFRNNTLEIYPDGTVSAGAVYLTDTGRSCLYALTSDASAITGVRCYRYRGAWEPL